MQIFYIIYVHAHVKEGICC